MAASWPVQMLHGEWVLNLDEEGSRTLILKSDSTVLAIARMASSNDTLSGTYTFRSGILSIKDHKDDRHTNFRIVVLNEFTMGMLDAENARDKDTVFMRRVR